MVVNFRIIDTNYNIQKYSVNNVTETQIKRFCLALRHCKSKNEEDIVLGKIRAEKGFNSLAKVVYEFAMNDEIIVYDYKHNKTTNKLVRSKRINTIKL